MGLSARAEKGGTKHRSIAKQGRGVSQRVTTDDSIRAISDVTPLTALPLRRPGTCYIPKDAGA